MTDQETSLVAAIKNHIVLWAAIVTCTGLIIHFFSIKFILEKIETVRCVCHTNQVHASGNTNTVNIAQPKTHNDLVEAVLRKQGDIK